MQTYIPKIMQPNILGRNLNTVPVTETDKGTNSTDPCDETLADMFNNRARASPDAKKKPPSETRKWKKIERRDDIETRPKQIQTEIDGHK